MKVTALERLHALDYARTLAVLCVLVVHFGNAYLQWYFPQIAAHRVDDLVGAVIPPELDGLFGFVNIVKNLNYMTMPVLFFLSGLFVWNGLVKKGVFQYLKTRFIRLIVPFGIALYVLIPMIHGVLQPPHTVSDGVMDYIRFLFSSPAYVLGPFWFLLVLFLFNAIASLLYIHGRSFVEKARTVMVAIIQKPLIMFGVLLACVGVLYAISFYTFGPGFISVGPLYVRKAFLLVYLFLFLCGVCISAETFQAHAKKLTDAWWYFVAFTGIGFLFTFGVSHSMNFLADADPLRLAGTAFMSVSLLCSVVTVSLRFLSVKNSTLAHASTVNYAMFFSMGIFELIVPYVYTSVPSLSHSVNALFVIILGFSVCYICALCLKRIPYFGTKVF